MPNIYARLVGGLGNQMFLYAAGRALAEQRGGRLVLDTSFFDSRRLSQAKDGTQRSFGLDALSIRANSPGPGEQLILVAARLFARRSWLTAAWNHSVGCFGPRLAADSATMPPAGSLILQGYWQSYRHFEHLRPVLLTELQPRDDALMAAENAYVEQVRAKSPLGEVISLHVRRGDYAIADVGLPVQSLSDIERRVALFNPKLPVIVFSDDPDWCRKNLSAPRFHIRDGRPVAADLYAMSLCDHNIIANSSLSWWGAWLNRHPNRRVIVPSRWFNRDFPDWRERLVPPGWEIV